MTILERLPRTAEGEIFLPVAGISEDGTEIPGSITVDKFQEIWARVALMSPPLSEDTYSGLLDTSDPGWKRSWEAFRTEGVI
jgi:hypothetical protein